MTSNALMELFSVIVAEKVLEDKSTGNLSYLGTVEGVEVEEAGLGQIIPLEVCGVFLFGPELASKSLEVSVVTRTLDGSLIDRSNWHPMVLGVTPDRGESTIRARVRAKGLIVPKSYGEVKVSMDLRETGSEEAYSGAAFWYMNFRTATPKEI